MDLATKIRVLVHPNDLLPNYNSQEEDDLRKLILNRAKKYPDLIASVPELKGFFNFAEDGSASTQDENTRAQTPVQDEQTTGEENTQEPEQPNQEHGSSQGAQGEKQQYGEDSADGSEHSGEEDNGEDVKTECGSACQHKAPTISDQVTHDLAQLATALAAMAQKVGTPRKQQKAPANLKFLQEARARKLLFSDVKTDSAARFIRKLEELAMLFNMKNDDILEVVGHLLELQPERWLRQSKKNYRTWLSFKKDFLLKYSDKSREDHELLQMLLSRKQSETERVSHFISAMQEINMSMEEPLSDAKVLQFVRKNLLPKYTLGLALQPITSFRELEEACRKLDWAFSSAKDYSPSSNELLRHEDFGDGRGHQSDQQQRRAVNSVHDAEEYLVEAATSGCFQCSSETHYYRDCPEVAQYKFCRLCGKKNTTTGQCCRKFVRQPARNQAAETRNTYKPAGQQPHQNSRQPDQQQHRSGSQPDQNQPSTSTDAILGQLVTLMERVARHLNQPKN